MRKEQLVSELLKITRRKSPNLKAPKSKAPKSKARSLKPSATKSTPIRRTTKTSNVKLNAKSPQKNTLLKKTPLKKTIVKNTAIKSNPKIVKRIEQARTRIEKARDLAAKTEADRNQQCGKDRVIVMVRDAYWLHIYWEITRLSVKRAQAVIGQHWHNCKSVLRLFEISDGPTANTTEQVVRDIEIHSGVNHWYLDVPNPPCSYRIGIGYLTENGQFYSLARSNVVATPAPSSKTSLDQHWAEVAENSDQIFAMSGGYDETSNSTELREVFEQRLRRPMGSPMMTRFGVGAAGVNGDQEFEFVVDAEMIIYGATKPDAYVTLKGEPINLREDGTFTMRMSMPSKRQVIPVVATTADGLKEKTIIVAVERNTKVMEPITREPGM